MARVDITLAKVAILLLYLRIFVPHQTGSRQMWFWIWFMVVFNVVYCLVLILLIQLQCIGHKTPQANGSCLDQHVRLRELVSSRCLLCVPSTVTSYHGFHNQRYHRSCNSHSSHRSSLGASNANRKKGGLCGCPKFWIRVSVLTAVHR
jgi:hypothetical protein